MTYQELLENATKTLTAANVPDAKTDAWRLFEHFTGMDRAAFFMASREEIPEKKDITAFENAVKKRAQRIPLQYITGTQDFFGREFKVGPATLIPRYDTEVVVEESLKLIKRYCETNVTEQGDVSILDLCTGTGCIIITLSEELGTKLCVVTDVSPEAVLLAKENASRLGCE
ncbi:MAG: peptide chain release factor N(5)-glutamine methyltransferase, partial [Lachnospiraceae bacterium]|nr:peptide chain release factor N(5)-glutamine methyltransferase [Lachnospiraceae bacterium]